MSLFQARCIEHLGDIQIERLQDRQECHEWVERCGPDDPEPDIRSTPTVEYEAWMDFQNHVDHIRWGRDCLYGLLALRQLHVRSRASSTTGTDPHLPSLFRLPDELANHVLTFWMSPRKDEGGLWWFF